MSRPPSRSSSINTAPLYVSANASSPPSPTQQHTTTLSHRLKHMFDKEKHSIFVANVTIQELGNVPQIDGDYAVRWKFRGRSPKPNDFNPRGLTPKPSLPNVKLGSNSSTSLRSVSTTSSKSPLGPNATTPKPITKSRTLPPAAFTTIPPVSPISPKKTTDPTPLRQSSGPVTTTAIPVESPEQILVEESEEDKAGFGLVERKSSSDSSKSASSGLPSIGVSTPENEASASSIDNLDSSTPTSRLTVPFPKLHRASSSDEIKTSSQISLPSIGHLLNPIRQRSASARMHSTFSSNDRKGATHVTALHLHSCSWEYELQYTVKIPLVRQEASGTATPSTKSNAPILGAGPLSDSGLRLIVERVISPKDAKGRTERKRFGVVDIDLAGFAGKGRTTRRFLLRGIRTNASLRVTVDMKWIGGEQNYSTPPMQIGHFVTGMTDLVGETDNLKNDLLLSKTASNSSASSEVSSVSGLASSSSLSMSRNPSNVSLVGPPPKIAYKSYEHHLLKPEPDPRRRSSSKDSRSSTPDGRHRSPRLESIPGTPAASTESPQSSIRSRFKRSHHHHHSHHFRSSLELFNPNQKINSPHQSWGITDLPPDVIVEAVWNPRPGLENGPFTFVPTVAPPVEPPQTDGLTEFGAEADPELKPSWPRRALSMRREKTQPRVVNV